MDRTTLVASQIEDGDKLLTKLREEEFPVTAAAWLKRSDGGSWYLYIASPVADQDVRFKGYRRVQAIIRGMPQPFWLDPLSVKMIETTDSVCEALQDVVRRFPGGRPIELGEASLGRLSIDAAYVYPRALLVP